MHGDSFVPQLPQLKQLRPTPKVEVKIMPRDSETPRMHALTGGKGGQGKSARAAIVQRMKEQEQAKVLHACNACHVCDACHVRTEEQEQARVCSSDDTEPMG